MNIHWTRFARDERGVALPLALLGLVAVSLLVTTALVTSSTELALSNAHQDGTRGIYEAEGALEEYVAARFAVGGGGAATRLQGSATPVSFTTGSGVAYSIAVGQLYDTGITTLANGNLARDETYSLLSQPADGRGRAVGSMITVHRERAPFQANINSAALVGAEELTLPGSSYSLSGIDGCTGDTLAGLTLAQGVKLTKQPKPGEIVGGIDSTDIKIADFAKHVLGGLTPEEAANLAQIKWGPISGGQAHGGSLNISHTLAMSTNRNWGCPADLVSCGTDPDTAFYPMVAVRPNGTTKVTLDGSGQGFLIVLGEAELKSHFKWNGVIVVVGDVHLNAHVRIDGALVALSDVTMPTIPDDDDEDEVRLNGQTDIRYNSCKIAQASNPANSQLMSLQPQQFNESTRAWFEVVR